jgi:type II secretory pathway pseudopilin PulG
MRDISFTSKWPRTRRGRMSAFTLFEILVSIAAIGLLLILFLQLLSGTNATIAASNKQINTASLARITLDRFGNDLAGVVLRGGATALYYSEAGNAGNSAIAFVTESRARGPSTSTSAWTTDTRSAFVGYKVTRQPQYIAGVTQFIPSLNRGDGRLTFSVQDIGNSSTYNLWDLFGTNHLRIPNDLSVNPTTDPSPNPRPDEKTLNWQIIASGIFRLHTSFVLDDGRIVQTPPTYQNFFANGGMGGSGCVPLAFSAQTSADPNKRYVKGLIVGVAVIDESTRDLAYKIDNNFWTTIGNKISRPTADGQTPVQVWNGNLATLTSNTPTDPTYLFQPVRQNIRFYERFYAVNL